MMLGVIVLPEPGSSATWMIIYHIHDLENWLAGVQWVLRAVNPCIEAWFVYHCADVWPRADPQVLSLNSSVSGNGGL